MSSTSSLPFSRFSWHFWLAMLAIMAILVVRFDCKPAKEDMDGSGVDADDEDEPDEATDAKHVERPGTEHKPKTVDKAGHHDDTFDHEAVIGSKEEAEKFKALPPEEAKRRLSTLVKKMDENNNGTVELKELEDWIINSFKKLDSEKAKKKFIEMDEDKDNYVTWFEVLHREYGYKEKELEEMRKKKSNESEAFFQLLEDDKEKFQYADVNKDGKLDKDEFKAFIAPHNYNHMSPIEAKKLLHQYDKNNDGFLSKEEFIQDVNKDNSNDTEHEIQHFLSYDKNKDGLLDQNELTPWVTSGMEDNAKFEAEHLLDESDANRDRVLSEEEILNQSDLFVGSQATDYGKHLTDLERLKEL